MDISKTVKLLEILIVILAICLLAFFKIHSDKTSILSDKLIELQNKQPQEYMSPNTYNIDLNGDGTAEQYLYEKDNDKNGCPDDMARISTFCIDKFEAYLKKGDLGKTNAEDTTAVAGSAFGKAPLSNVTWFQASVACANAGKRLCSNYEWQLAALGTPDPHVEKPPKGEEPCNIWPKSIPEGSKGGNSTKSWIYTGTASKCKSRYGVYDMSGNVWEWTIDWAATSQTTEDLAGKQENWPAAFGHDATFNIAGYAIDPHQGGWVPGLPHAFIRGAFYAYGKDAGPYSICINSPPSRYRDGPLGFRCCKNA